MKRSLKLLMQRHTGCAHKGLTQEKHIKRDFRRTEKRPSQSSSAPSAVQSSLHSSGPSRSPAAVVEQTKGNPPRLRANHRTVVDGSAVLSADRKARRVDPIAVGTSATDTSDERVRKKIVKPNKLCKDEKSCSYQETPQKFETNLPASSPLRTRNAVPSASPLLSTTQRTKPLPDKQQIRDAVPKGSGGGRGRTTRYILFAGDLPFDTTPQQLKAFFKKKLEPHIKGVRLLTQRGTNKPKGCAFVEFDCKEALQIALNYHHHELNGRKINIELSAGGGGNSKSRVQRIRQKNKRLKLGRRKLFREKTSAKSTPAQPPH